MTRKLLLIGIVAAVVPAVPVMLATTTVPGRAGAATRMTTAAALPDACKLVRRTEAQALTGVKMESPTRGRTSCTYNGYPTGPAAQVSIFVTTTVPRTLLIDRRLGHRFRSLPRLGDQAFEEEWNIFVRKSAVWLSIALVRIDDWTLYRKRLERAAAIAISRLTQSRKPAVVSSTSAAADVFAPHEPPALGASGTERHGGGITHYVGVVYQPGVVRIGGGENAIREVNGDGRTWTIDAHAPGAADLRIGKIMLATARASGRVVALTHTGSSLELTLAPAPLTDVIRDGTFEWRGPLTLAQPLAASAALPATPTVRPSTRTTPAAGGLETTPICCSRGLGAHVAYNRGAGRLSATAQVDWDPPEEIWFKIKIDHGRLIDSGLELRSVPALEYEISGATLDSSGNVRSSAVAVRPMTFQLAGPIAVTFSQKVNVSMQLAGRATLQGHGRYFLSDDSGRAANLGFWFPARLRDLTMSTDIPLTENTLALGVGENAFSFGWSLRATAGVGGADAAGAWYQLRAGLALVADGSLMSLKPACVTVALSVDDRFGFGSASSVSDYGKTIFGKPGARRARPVPAVGSGSPFHTVWHPPRAEHCAPRKGAAR